MHGGSLCSLWPQKGGGGICPPAPLFLRLCIETVYTGVNAVGVVGFLQRSG
jgi:hypothetical protein